MRFPSVATAIILVWGCGGGAETVADGGTDAGPPVPARVADHTFGEFEPWATPIEDYREVGEEQFPGAYDQAIHDLRPHGGRLFLGYGDATRNMGEHIPIEFRAFVSPDDPVPVVEETSSEEQLDRYRVLGGELWHAGIDPIDADELAVRPLIVGNVYRRDPDGWVKHRTVPGAEHVHDVALFGGDILAVGSGANNRTEFESGQIFRYLWRSDDDGESFETVERVMYTEGDTRYVNLMATEQALYVFGYEYDGNTIDVRNAKYAAGLVGALPPTDPLSAVFANGTDSLPDGSALLRGIDVAGITRVNEIWHVGARGEVTSLDAFSGSTVADVSVVFESEEILYLSYEGDAPGAPGPYAISVMLASMDDPGDVVEIASLESDAAPRAIAYFMGSLFLGDNAGVVYKAQGQSDL